MRKLEETFKSYSDGSGAEALVVICGNLYSLHLSRELTAHLVGGRTHFSPKVRKMLEHAKKQFMAKVDALGPEWRKMNEEMYR